MTDIDPPSDSVPEPDLLPCGCFITYAIVDGVRTMTYAPCKPSCVNYRNALGLTADADLPVKYRRA